MARWFHNRPSEKCDETEIKVANKLRRLGKRWTIRWGFYYQDNNGLRREGDFLIFDPLHGLLVLEVKGDRFRQFAPTGRWEGDPEKDKDHPLFQLDQEHAGVLKTLTETEPGWRPVAKALCLPNVVIPEGQKTWEGIPREMIVDGRDLERIDSVFARFFEGEPPRDIQKHREVFLRAYGKGGRPEDLKHFIDHNEIIFRKQLTRQYQLLDILEGNQQLFIEGGAGTGKTWNAVEKAVRLAENGEGAHVLLLCYNIALSRFLRGLVSRRKLERGTITVYQWEELAHHLLSACGMESGAPPSDASREDKLRYYDQELPALLLECVREAEFTDRLPRFDALVVDEAQDHDTAFPDAPDASDAPGGNSADNSAAECGWWSIYFALLREGPASPIALFYDTAQRPPFRGRGGFDARLIAARLSQPAFARLPHALRYTQPIYDFLQTLNSPGTEGLVAQLSEPDDLPEGPDVITVDLKEAGEEEVRAAVTRIISDWVEVGYCLPEDVLILHTRTDLKASVLGACGTLAGLPLVEYGTTPEEGKKAIRHLSINRAKGLDAVAVIMVGTEPFQQIRKVDNQYTYFMGASRAKQMLAVVHGS
jgi:hypothetical protein